MKWFRLHSEFATDPKLKTFTKAQRYDLICLLCLANDAKERGVILLDAEDIAATLEMDEADYAAFITKLERKGILSVRGDGAVVFNNWLARQYDKPSDTPEETAKRKRDSRSSPETSASNQQGNQRENAPENNGHAQSRAGHSHVTRGHAPYSDTDSESDSESEQESPQSPPRPKTRDASPPASQAAVLEFANCFRGKFGEGPHIPDKNAKQLVTLKAEIGGPRFQQALGGFFADQWASESGYSVVTFLSQPVNRWTHAAPKGQKQSAPPGKSAMALSAEREEARLRAIFEPESLIPENQEASYESQQLQQTHHAA